MQIVESLGTEKGDRGETKSLIRVVSVVVYKPTHTLLGFNRLLK